jgi:hypothetical protein
MCQYIFKGESFGRVDFKNSLDERLELITGKMVESVNVKLLDLFHGVGVEGVLTGKDLVVDGLLLLGLKGVLSEEDCVTDNPQGPYINFVSMTYGSAIMIFLDHLRRDIIGSSTNCISFSMVLNIRSQPKIPDLNLKSLSQEQVAQLDIPMHNISGMNFLKPIGQLPDVKASLLLC